MPQTRAHRTDSVHPTSPARRTGQTRRRIGLAVIAVMAVVAILVPLLAATTGSAVEARAGQLTNAQAPASATPTTPDDAPASTPTNDVSAAAGDAQRSAPHPSQAQTDPVETTPTTAVPAPPTAPPATAAPATAAPAEQPEPAKASVPPATAPTALPSTSAPTSASTAAAPASTLSTRAVSGEAAPAATPVAASTVPSQVVITRTRVLGPVITVSGAGAAPEGTLLWELLTADGTPVAKNFAQAGAEEWLDDYVFTVTAPGPGTYQVRVWVPNEENGAPEPAAPFLATTTVTVTTTSPPPPPFNTFAAQLYTEINKARTGRGLPALPYGATTGGTTLACHSTSGRTAQQHADRLLATNTFSHASDLTGAEALAAGPDTPAGTVARWLASPPHRAVLLGAGDTIDVGTAIGTGPTAGRQVSVARLCWDAWR